MLKKKKSILILILVFMTSIIISSCYYDYGLDVSDYDIVATFYDDEANFRAINTFALPDSVIHFVGDGAIKLVDPWKRRRSIMEPFA